MADIMPNSGHGRLLKSWTPSTLSGTIKRLAPPEHVKRPARRRALRVLLPVLAAWTLLAMASCWFLSAQLPGFGGRFSLAVAVSAIAGALLTVLSACALYDALPMSAREETLTLDDQSFSLLERLRYRDWLIVAALLLGVVVGVFWGAA